MRKTLITAHTGCLNTPLNSIQSVMDGLKAGADIIEVDVNVTKDGVAVLVHDDQLSTPAGIKRVQDLTYEEWRSLPWKQEWIRLEEVLPLVREQKRIINLDVKSVEAVEAMIHTVEKARMRDDVIITGCEKEWAAYIRANHRPYQVLLNASTRLYPSHYDDYESFIKQTCQDAIAASCCGININYHFCREFLLEYAALRCLPVLVWTVDDPMMMEHFLKAGVHSITTNQVDTLVDLREKGPIM